jgi:GNAT superfamily N-acetyltransferase
MIRLCAQTDLSSVLAIVNDGAPAYKGSIPVHSWHEPYMRMADLKREIRDGVRFWAYEAGGSLVGVMGIQDRGDVDLIRHAYVMTSEQKKGIGTLLLKHLEATTPKAILIGTWEAATWAISFYQKSGYRLLPREDANLLLVKYWSIPDRQLQTSVVLASPRWRGSLHGTAQ